MIGFNLRDITPADHATVAALNEKAFGRPDEARIVEKLRADGDAMLELVAVSEGQTIGHIMYYHMRIHGRLSALGLGPMSVDPWVQREGVGTSIVHNSLTFIQKEGQSLVFVLGDPKFYRRFGFEAKLAEPFDGPFKGDPAFMAARLRHGPPTSGRVIFPDAFGIAQSGAAG